MRDTKNRRQEAGQINFELAQELAADGNRGLTNMVMQELSTNPLEASPNEYEAIIAEVQSFLTKQLSNDEWLEDCVEREEQAYQ